MPSTRQRLPKPPIVEAVIDIECVMRPDFNLGSVEAEARVAFRDTYPKVQTRNLQRLHVESALGTEPSVSREEGLNSILFLLEDEKQLVQFRTEGYSFNRLAPYTVLDDYLAEIERTWRLFESIVKPLKVQTVKLRNINRIPLPLVDGNIKLENYLALGPQAPDNLVLVNFLTRTWAVDEATGYRVTTTLAAKKPTDYTLPVVLDIEVAADLNDSEGNWSDIARHIETLRDLKFRVFTQNLVEDACAPIFQA